MKMKFNEEIENRKVIVQEQRERQKNMIKDTRKALEDYKVNKYVGYQLRYCLQSSIIGEVQYRPMRLCCFYLLKHIYLNRERFIDLRLL